MGALVGEFFISRGVNLVSRLWALYCKFNEPVACQEPHIILVKLRLEGPLRYFSRANLSHWKLRLSQTKDFFDLELSRLIVMM